MQIRITGFKGEQPLSPANYDVQEVAEILEAAVPLLVPAGRKDRPSISYGLEAGSVVHKFTTILAPIIGLNAILGSIQEPQDLELLELPMAHAIERFQKLSIRRGYAIFISTSLPKTQELVIDAGTHFFLNEAFWLDAEFYFYGKVMNAGGKERANIHLLTDAYGIIRIDTPIEFLEAFPENMLYKSFGIRAAGKQHVEKGTIDFNTLKFLEIIDYEARYDRAYLAGLRKKAKASWLQKTDATEWLNQVRGYEG